MVTILDPQQLAATRPDRSTWLLANAGSGKTKVLVDRLLRLLLSGARPGGILCLTFTVTAANEMLSRVQAILGQWLVLDEAALDAEIAALGESPSPAKRDLARRLFLNLAEDPEGLNIRTVHGFCQLMISRFPLEVGVAPGSVLMNEEQESTIKAELRDAVLLDEEQSVQTALEYLLMHFAHLLDGDKLTRLIEDGAQGVDAIENIDLEAFFVQLAKVLGLPPQREYWNQDVVWQDFSASLDRDEARDIVTRIGAAKILKTDEKFLKRLQDALAIDEGDVVACAQGFAGAFRNVNGKGELIKNPLTKGVREDAVIDNWLAVWKQKIQQLVEQLAAVETLLATKQVLVLAQSFLQKYRNYKSEHALLDYNDQIMLVRGLLGQPGGLAWVRYKLDCRIDHLFLDEAQDTSAAQWAILEGLSDDFFAGDKDRAQTLFVVGDPKQSIYRFQGADPEGFFSKRQKFCAHDHVQSKQLLRSYRSAQGILDVVDATFAAYQSQNFALDDPTFAELTHQSVLEGCAAEVILAPPLEFPDTNADTARRWLVQHLARTIHSWIGQRSIEALGRTVEAGDILILFNDRLGMFAPLAQELRRLNVPVVSGENTQLLNPLAMQDIVALLRYLLCRNDDYQLACVLKSAFISLAEDDLMYLALTRGVSENLHQSLYAHKGVLRFAAAAEWLESLWQRADFMTINSLLGMILHQPCPRGASGLQALKGRLGAGVERVVQRIENLAIAFEREECTGLQGFVDYLLFRRSTDRNRVEGQGVVRLMTIHAAKGLQAPIVLIPETWVTAKTARPPKLYTARGLLMLDTGSEIKPELVIKAKEAMAAADCAEHWRLLYVALTRAAYELHLYTAHAEPAKNLKAKQIPWYVLLDQAMSGLETEKVSDSKLFPPCSSSRVGFATEWAPRRYRSYQTRPIKVIAGTLAPPIDDVPSWLFTPVTTAPSPEILRYSVAHAMDQSKRRGIVLHSVLEQLCGGSASGFVARIAEVLPRLLAAEPHFNPEEGAKMHETLLNVVANPEVAEIIAHAESEVEIGLSTAKSVELRRLDCLWIEPNRVRVVDFKSDCSPTTEIPPAYRAQLENYVKILQQIFPKRRIDMAVLWLVEARLHWL
ncbi:MAG: UvrD-helicase domain-containing protein [Alphaproteobacteria bacterium]|nr:UvrD-helicase domain-containing protein [Alphaproteobacteria bacterium]